MGDKWGWCCIGSWVSQVLEKVCSAKSDRNPFNLPKEMVKTTCINFLPLWPAKCQIRHEDRFNVWGYQNMMPGHRHHAPEGAVTDEYGAMVEWWIRCKKLQKLGEKLLQWHSIHHSTVHKLQAVYMQHRYLLQGLGLEVTSSQYLFIAYQLSVFSTVTHCCHWASSDTQSLFSLKTDAHLDSTSATLTVLGESHTWRTCGSTIISLCFDTSPPEVPSSLSTPESSVSVLTTSGTFLSPEVVFFSSACLQNMYKK
jgi:hypothetical protein